MNNRLFVRSRKMLKQKDKEHNTGRANIMDEYNLILQSLPAATTAYTSFVNPTKYQERKRWVSWFSKSEPEIKDSKAILQSSDSAIIQLNWATFSRGLSSMAIILVLLILFGIC